MGPKSRHEYRFGPFRLDAVNRLLYRNADLIPLPPKVFDTLLLLITNGGQVLTKEEMMNRLWPDTFVEEGTLAQYIFVLRKALGNGGVWIENHPRRGYRFSAQVEEAHFSPGEPANKEDAASRNRIKRFRVTAASLAITGVIVLAGLAWNSRKEGASTSSASVAVLPFRTVSDSADDYVADGITGALITRLVNVKGLRVVSYSRVRQFKNTREDSAAIGRKLGVETVIEGTVRKTSGRMRVSVHAIDSRTADALWADDRFDAEAAGLLDVERRLAETVAFRYRGQLTASEQGQIRKSGTTNADAYDLVLRARHILRDWNTLVDLQKAISLLERAVQLDPEFADAYGWLAFAQRHAYLMGLGLDKLDEAIASSNQALSKDPNSLVAMRALVDIQYTSGREVEALLMARRALETNPDDLDATAAAAEAYFRTGISDRAIQLYEKALSWEPANPEFRTQLARIYFYLGDDRKGISVMSAAPVTPSSAGTFGMTFVILMYVQTGQLHKAVQAIRAEQGEDPPRLLRGFESYVRGGVMAAAGDQANAQNIWSQLVVYAESLLAQNENPLVRYWLSLNYAKLGNREKALHHIHRRLAANPRHPASLFFLAEVHALLGNRREALDALKAAVENGFFNLPMIDGMARSRICTLYTLRKDPEFLAIRGELARRVDELRARY